MQEPESTAPSTEIEAIVVQLKAEPYIEWSLALKWQSSKKIEVRTCQVSKQWKNHRVTFAIQFNSNLFSSYF